MIRDHRITTEMGISLINDSNYSYDVIRNLIAAAGDLFHAAGKGQTDVEHRIALDDHEIRALLKEEAP